jgi:hypothetical protein
VAKAKHIRLVDEGLSEEEYAAKLLEFTTSRALEREVLHITS